MLTLGACILAYVFFASSIKVQSASDTTPPIVNIIAPANNSIVPRGTAINLVSTYTDESPIWIDTGSTRKNLRSMQFVKGMYGDAFAEETERDYIYDTVIRTSQDGAGIFDKNDSQRIEQLAYRRLFLWNSAKIELMRNYRRLRGRGEYQPDPNDKDAVKLREWRQEFIQRYSEEP